MDLNVAMREQVRTGLQAELDKAVTDGDTEAARKVGDKIAALAVQMAPKAPPFGDAEIRAELDKQTWFGTDPKRSAKAVDFGKTMDPKKFATAEAFATAIVKAVDEEFKTPSSHRSDGGDGDGAPDGETDEEREAREATETAAGKKPRKTDGPGEGDATQRTGTRRTSGPWTKLSDAPLETQKEIKRQADKFVSAHATKEQREGYISRALGSHYAQDQRTKAGKK